MQVRNGEVPRARQLARTGNELNREARTRPYAIRKPKQYAVSRPGDLVEVDTLDVRPLPGVGYYHHRTLCVNAKYLLYSLYLIHFLITINYNVVRIELNSTTLKCY